MQVRYNAVMHAYKHTRFAFGTVVIAVLVQSSKRGFLFK